MPISKTGKAYYTNEQYNLARYEATALEYAKAAGYQLEKKGGWWTMKEHDSFVFSPNGMWFWNSRDMKGGAIEFLTQIEHKTMVEAVLTLAGERSAERTNTALPKRDVFRNEEDYNRYIKQLEDQRIGQSVTGVAIEDNPFYGKIDFLGSNGAVGESLYYDDKTSYLNEILDSQNSGRPISYREITGEDYIKEIKLRLDDEITYIVNRDDGYIGPDRKLEYLTENQADIALKYAVSVGVRSTDEDYHGSKSGMNRYYGASEIDQLKKLFQEERNETRISVNPKYETPWRIKELIEHIEKYENLGDKVKEQYRAHNEQEKAKPFELPQKAENSKRLFAYLCGSRGLDRDIVHDLVKQGKIYESSAGYTKDGETKTLNNAVFVGFDNEGKARSGFQRGLVTNSARPFKRDVAGSEKEYAFSIDGKDVDTVAVFEASIDAISHATIEKLSGHDYTAINRIALGGIAFNALHRYLDDHPNIKNVVLCVDADQAGDKAAENLKNEMYSAGYTPENGYHCERQIPTGHKDFNEYLLSYREAIEERKEVERHEAEREYPVDRELDDFYRPEVVPEHGD